MVGVSTSQACRSCKRRKKGCDLVRPTCSRCDHLGIRCAYDQPMFIVATQQSLGSRYPPGSVSSSSTALDSGVQTGLVTASERSLSRTALEIEIDEAFWSAYMPVENASNCRIIDSVVTAPWVPILQFVASQDNTTRLALDACAFMALARLRDDSALLQQGLRLYSRALYETNRMLQQSVEARSDNIIACIRILGLCEQFRGDGIKQTEVSSQGTDWQSHLQGIAKIFELQGPEKISTEPGRSLFIDWRTQATISAMTRRQSPMLSIARWTTTPWLLVRRTIKDELVDIMIMVAKFLQSCDEMKAVSDRSGPSTIERLCHKIIKSMVDIHQHLSLWEGKVLDLCEASYGPSSAEAPANLASVCKDHGFGFFHLVLNFWAVNLVVNSTARLMLRRTWRERTSPTLALPSTPDPEEFASCIADHCDYYFRPGAGLFGAQLASWPMGTALHFYAACGKIDSPGSQKMRRLFRYTRTASFTATFLRSIAADPMPDRLKGDVKEPEQHVQMARGWWGMRKPDVESDTQEER